MTKLYLMALASLFASGLHAQTDTLRGQAAADLLRQLKFDTTAFLKTAGSDACKCIDSALAAGSEDKIKTISGCIDEQVTSYQLALKLNRSMTSGNPKDNSITLETDKSSNEYKRYYFEVERWLKDNCTGMNRAIANNDVEGAKSVSRNVDAVKAYDDAVKFLREEKYSQAIPLFEKAVSIDPEFAFAWDNLGVSYRRTDNYAKAEWAYKESLKVDPKGRTPLMNLPVVYMLQKRNDDAITAYKQLLEVYNDDPESYYGIAIVYLQNKQDPEAALPFMCKAYNLYIQQRSPYRSDAEKVISMIYGMMKKAGKEDQFHAVLKQHNIRSN